MARMVDVPVQINAKLNISDADRQVLNTLAALVEATEGLAEAMSTLADTTRLMADTTRLMLPLLRAEDERDDEGEP